MIRRPGWFSKSIVDTTTTMLTEPFVTDYCRANIWHVRGSDFDLLVDTGMGICPLAPEIETTPGKPLLVVATHVHLDHVGSLHEFAWRAGPRVEAQFFEDMPDEATYANMFRNLPGAVSELPYPGWHSADYAIAPAPLHRLLDEGDLIELGDRSFTVLHLPGHSPGSIGLFDELNGTLFSGDAIHGGFRPHSLLRHHAPAHRPAGAHRPWRPRRQHRRVQDARDIRGLSETERGLGANRTSLAAVSLLSVTASPCHLSRTSWGRGNADRAGLSRSIGRVRPRRTWFLAPTKWGRGGTAKP